MAKGRFKEKEFLFCFNSKSTFFISIICFLYNLPFLWIPPLWVFWNIPDFDFVFVCCLNCGSLAAGTMLSSQRSRDICLLTGWWMTKQTLVVLSQFWPQFPLISSPAAGADSTSQSPWGLPLISSDGSVHAGVSQLSRWYHGPETPLPITIGPRQRPLERAQREQDGECQQKASACIRAPENERNGTAGAGLVPGGWKEATARGKNHPQRRTKKREHEPWHASPIYGNQCPLRLPL